MKLNTAEEKGEDMNVRQVHAQILREKAEPHENWKRVSDLVHFGIYAPLIIWGLWYLATHSGGFKGDNYVEHKFTIPLEKRFEYEENRSKEK